MLPKQMETLLNNQIQHEYYAAFLYLSMSAYCHSLNLQGFASWMKKQSDEEQEHAQKIFKFIVDRGGRVELKEIKQPPKNFKSVTDMVGKILDHERHVTSLIYKLFETAQKLPDYPSQVMLQWFIAEQVEEEAQAEAVLRKLELISERSSSLLYLDKELGKRGSEA